MPDGRVEPRRVVISRVEVRWQDALGEARVSTALVEDTSRRGACLRISEPIDAGTRLKVAGRREDFAGVAKYCRPDGAGYLIGIYRDPQPVAER
jgi:hypothetical protein